mgnify:CR=1 FL=1
MSAFASLILFVALAAFSLIAVSWVNSREIQRKVLSKKLKELRQHILNTEELILEVDQMVESRAISKLMNDEIIEMILAMKNANPESGYLDASHQTAIARADALNDESIPVVLDRLKESDAQIAKGQKTLENAAVILRRQQTSGKLSFEEMNAFLSELSWGHLMVEVLTHIGQGHKAQRRHDVLSAHAFYKKAQQLLMHSSHPDKRRHRLIKELSEMLANKRLAVSEDIMPENHLNPEPQPENKTEQSPLEVPTVGDGQEVTEDPEVIPGKNKKQSSKA